MKRHIKLAMALSAATMLTGVARAAELKETGTIAIPGEKLVDLTSAISTRRPAFITSPTAATRRIDIIDTKTNKFVKRVGSFVWRRHEGRQAEQRCFRSRWRSVRREGNLGGRRRQHLKIIDPATGKVTATINTGGTTRVDEMAYDPKDEVFIGVNNAEDPPFATLISTKPDHKVIGKVVFEDAGDGAEQPAYNPTDGMFYMSIPQIGKDPKKGGVAVIDPKTAKLVKTLPVDNCHPAGLAFGPDDNFVLGCTANGKDDMPAVTVVMNAKSGRGRGHGPGHRGRRHGQLQCQEQAILHRLARQPRRAGARRYRRDHQQAGSDHQA